MKANNPEPNYTGVLEILHIEETKKQPSINKYFIVSTLDGKKYELIFPSSKPTSLQSGRRITVDGKIANNQIILSNLEKSFPSLQSFGTLNSIGNKKLAVILITNQDDRVPLETVNQVNDLVSASPDSISNWYKENSFNQFSLSGDVFGWYDTADVGLTSEYAGCPLPHLQEIANLINNYTKSISNFNYDNYDLVSYILAYQSYDDSCAAGYAYIGGKQSFINLHLFDSRYSSPDAQYSGKNVFKHELGHNLGLYHARGIDCGDKAIDSYDRCNTTYFDRDYSDIMGGGWISSAQLTQINSVHRLLLGWIPDRNTIEINQDNYNRQIALSVMNTENTNTGKPVLIKIRKEDTNEYYYVGYYLTPAWENGWWTGPLLKGAFIHLHNISGCGDNNFSACKIDTTPKSEDDEFISDSIDSYLSDGHNFVDQINNLEVMQIDHDENTVNLNIKYKLSGIPTLTPAPTNTITPTKTPYPTKTPVPSLTPISSPSPTLTPTPTRIPSVTPTFTLTPTLTPVPTVTVTPGPQTTTLSFKVGIPRMGTSEVPQDRVKVDIVNSSGTKVYTGSIALVREGDRIYRTKGSGISFNLGSSGTYRVYVKLTTSIGRVYNNVSLVSGSVLDCTIENTSCGDMKPSSSLLSVRALLLGDTDNYSYNWINIADFDKLVEEFLGRVSTKYTDFNLDGSVDVLDLEVLGLNFNKRGD